VLDGAELVNSVPAIQRAEGNWGDSSCLDLDQQALKSLESPWDLPAVFGKDALVVINADDFRRRADAVKVALTKGFAIRRKAVAAGYGG